MKDEEHRVQQPVVSVLRLFQVFCLLSVFIRVIRGSFLPPSRDQGRLPAALRCWKSGPRSRTRIFPADEGQVPTARWSRNAAGSKIIVCNVSSVWQTA